MKQIVIFTLTLIALAAPARAVDPRPVQSSSFWVEQALTDVGKVADEKSRVSDLKIIAGWYVALGQHDKARQLSAALPTADRAFVDVDIIVHGPMTDPDAIKQQIAQQGNDEARDFGNSVLFHELLKKDDPDRAAAVAMAMSKPSYQTLLYNELCKYYCQQNDFKSARATAKLVTGEGYKSICRRRIVVGELLAAGNNDVVASAVAAGLDRVQVDFGLAEFVDADCKAGRIDRADVLVHLIVTPQVRGNHLCQLAVIRWNAGDKVGGRKALDEANEQLPNVEAMYSPLLEGVLQDTRVTFGDTDTMIAEMRAKVPRPAFDFPLARVLILAGKPREAIAVLGEPKDGFDNLVMGTLAKDMASKGQHDDIVFWLSKLESPEQRVQICLGAATGVSAAP